MLVGHLLDKEVYTSHRKMPYKDAIHGSLLHIAAIGRQRDSPDAE